MKLKAKKTVKFIAFGAEEYTFFGSYYYVKTLKEQGQLVRVKNVINLDMVGKGEFLWVWAAPEWFKQQIASVLDQSLRGEFNIQWSEPLPVSDHWPFIQEGIPAVLLILWPYEDYHLSSDTYDKVEEATIEKIGKAATAITEYFVGIK